MAILLQPDSLSFASNLKKFVISSSEEIRFKLLLGETLLIDESYSPDASGKIEIDVKEVVISQLGFSIPTTDSFEQTSILKLFTAQIDEAIITFTALRAGVENLSDVPSDFLTDNWLTWQPQTKQTSYNQPEWLTYYSTVPVTIKVKFYMSDNTTQIITLANQAAGKCVTYNMQFAHIMSLQAGSKFGYFDVWAENAGGARLNYIQRYIYQDLGLLDEFFLAENSLGGIDTVVMSGDSVALPEVENIEALFDEESIQLDGSHTRIISKNTGWKSKLEAQWLWDFFSSKNRYKLQDGAIKKISIRESDIQNSFQDDLKSFTFKYRLSADNGLLNIPRSPDPLPENLEITTPEGLFFLAPRLVEFPSAEFVDEFLLPVQSPFAQSWMKMSLGAFRNSILDSISDITSPLAHTHTWESITGKPVTFTPSAHNHTWDSIQNKPESFIPSVHSHAIDGIIGLSNALSGKEPGLGNPATDGQILSSTVAGVRSWVNRYVLPVATAAILGGVMVGTGLNANAQGLLSHADFSVETGIGGTLGHIKSSERTAWNTHKNDSSVHLSADDRLYFNKLKTYFLFAADNSSVRTTINFYSESGVSAFGIGSGGTGSSVNVIDNLLSTSATEALSANMGRYLNTLISGKSDSGHSHTWASITGKPASFIPSAHTHLKAEITDFPTTWAWASLTGVPTTFAPSAHSHAITDITNLQTTLNGKEAGLSNPSVTGYLLSSTTAGVRSWVAPYAHPVTSGNKHIPSGGSTGQILKWSADGTAVWAVEYSYTHPATHPASMIDESTTRRFITDTERINWNNAFGWGNHASAGYALAANLTTHINDTSSHLSTDERNYFNKLKTYFLFAADNSSVRTTINFYSESGVSAFGIGSGGTGSSVNVIDNLLSTSATEALSANMGRYLNTLISGKSDSGHSHTWASITGKPASFTPSAHTHLKAEITDFPTTWAWASLTGVPTTFAPSAHSHAITDITNLQTTLNGKEAGLGNPSVTGYLLSSTIAGVRSWVAPYAHPVTSGNKHIPSGGSTGQILKWSADGTAVWAVEYSYTHPATHPASMIDESTTRRFITDTERINWNNAFGWGNHASAGYALAANLTTHINDTSSHLSIDERNYFNKLKTYFLFAADNSSVRTTINFYSESGVSAFGIGSGGTGSSVNVIDNLLSTSATEALSANMGRYLNTLISGKSDSGHSHTWASITGKPASFTPSAHTHAWSEIVSGKPTTLSGYGISSTDTLFDSKYSRNYKGGATIDADLVNETSSINEYRWLNTPVGSISILTTNNSYAPNWITQEFVSIALNRRWFRNYNGSNAAWSAWYEFFHSGNLLNIGTTASSARTALGLGSMALETASNYLTTATAASTYLPLSGGTLTFAGNPLTLYRTNANQVSLWFKGSSGDLGGLGFSSAATPAYIATSGTAYTLYHSGNSNSSSVAWAASAFTEGGTLLSNKYLGINALNLLSPNLSSYNSSITTTNFRTSLFGSSAAGFQIKAWRWDTAPSLVSGYNANFSTAIVWSGGDTHAYLAVDYSGQKASIGGGSGENIIWRANLYHSLNSNLTTIDWSAKNLALAGSITGATTITASSHISTSGRLLLGNTTDGVVIYLTGTFGDILGINTSLTEYNDLRLRASNTDQMFLRTNGNVDIGYSAAQSYKFAVNGTTHFNGASTINGALTIAGALSGVTTLSASGNITTDSAIIAKSYIRSSYNAISDGYLAMTSGSSVSMIPNFLARSESGSVGLYVSASRATNQSAITGFSTAAVQMSTDFNATSGNLLSIANNYVTKVIIAYNGDMTNYSTTQSTAYNIGSLVLYGGLGIAKDLFSNGKAYFASHIESNDFLKAANSVKIGNWEFVKNADLDISVKLNGVLKAKLDSSGNILAVGGVSAFAI